MRTTEVCELGFGTKRPPVQIRPPRPLNRWSEVCPVLTRDCLRAICPNLGSGDVRTWERVPEGLKPSSPLIGRGFPFLLASGQLRNAGSKRSCDAPLGTVRPWRDLRHPEGEAGSRRLREPLQPTGRAPQGRPTG